MSMGVYIKGMEIPRSEPLLIKLNPDGSVSTTAKNGYRKYAAISAADVRPVVSGKWSRIDYEPYGHDYKCSVCGWKNDMATHFCPNCGADMRE